MAEKMAELMNTNLVRREAYWREGCKEMRDTFIKLQHQGFVPLKIPSQSLFVRMCGVSFSLSGVHVVV